MLIQHLLHLALVVTTLASPLHVYRRTSFDAEKRSGETYNNGYNNGWEAAKSDGRKAAQALSQSSSAQYTALLTADYAARGQKDGQSGTYKASYSPTTVVVDKPWGDDQRTDDDQGEEFNDGWSMGYRGNVDNRVTNTYKPYMDGWNEYASANFPTASALAAYNAGYAKFATLPSTATVVDTPAQTPAAAPVNDWNDDDFNNGVNDGRGSAFNDAYNNAYNSFYHNDMLARQIKSDYYQRGYNDATASKAENSSLNIDTKYTVKLTADIGVSPKPKNRAYTEGWNRGYRQDIHEGFNMKWYDAGWNWFVHEHLKSDMLAAAQSYNSGWISGQSEVLDSVNVTSTSSVVAPTAAPTGFKDFGTLAGKSTGAADAYAYAKTIASTLANQISKENYARGLADGKAGKTFNPYKKTALAYKVAVPAGKGVSAIGIADYDEGYAAGYAQTWADGITKYVDEYLSTDKETKIFQPYNRGWSDGMSEFKASTTTASPTTTQSQVASPQAESPTTTSPITTAPTTTSTSATSSAEQDASTSLAQSSAADKPAAAVSSESATTSSAKPSSTQAADTHVASEKVLSVAAEENSATEIAPTTTAKAADPSTTTADPTTKAADLTTKAADPTTKVAEAADPTTKAANTAPVEDVKPTTTITAETATKIAPTSVPKAESSTSIEKEVSTSSSTSSRSTISLQADPTAAASAE